MGGKSSAPKPPDPKQTAQAQTSTNVASTLANAFMGNVNQITPDGTLKYNQTGEYDYYDEYTKSHYKIPTFTATQALSPGQQQIYNTNQQTQQNLAALGRDQSAKVNSYLSTPWDPESEGVNNINYSLYKQLYEPLQSQQREAFETKVRNRGITAGSDAYSNLSRDFERQMTDTQLQAMLSGRSQAINESLTKRNQPLNEIAALLGGSQVSQPNFMNTNMPQIPTTDVAGIINQNYNQRMQAYQANQQNGGLGGMFASLMSLGARLI